MTGLPPRVPHSRFPQRPPLPIDGLELDALALFMAGGHEETVIQLSIAVSLKRIADRLDREPGA